MQIGDYITFGNYANAPITWRVAAEKDGRWLLISRDILEIRPFHPVDVSEGQKVSSTDGFYTTDWKTCELREWLNGEFLKAAFSQEEVEHIVSTQIFYTQEFKTLYSKWPSVQEVEDRLFLLSDEEAREYLPDGAERYANLTPHAREQLVNPCPLHSEGAWWLRNHCHENRVNVIGYFYNSLRTGISNRTSGADVMSQDIGVRPAMWCVGVEAR